MVRLSTERASGFANEGRRDPLTKEPFVAGQEVVFCATCQSAHFRTSWVALGKCACGATRFLENFDKPSSYLRKRRGTKRRRILIPVLGVAGTAIYALVFAGGISLPDYSRLEGQKRLVQALRRTLSGEDVGLYQRAPITNEPLKPHALLRDPSRPIVMEVQLQLNALGCDAGPVDGVIGPRTRGAVRAFQRRANRDDDGLVTPGLMAALAEARRQGLRCTMTDAATRELIGKAVSLRLAPGEMAPWTRLSPGVCLWTDDAGGAEIWLADAHRKPRLHAGGIETFVYFTYRAPPGREARSRYHFSAC